MNRLPESKLQSKGATVARHYPLKIKAPLTFTPSWTPTADYANWNLRMEIIKTIPHLCRHCGSGRLLQVANDEDEIVVWCPNCERSADDHLQMCFCGHTFPSGVRSLIKCVKNPELSPQNPHNVVIMIDDEGSRNYSNKIHMATLPKESRSDANSY